MPQDNKRTDEIERTIERTRADLDETLDEIEARFTPEYFADQVIDYVRGPGAGRIAQAIRDNPVAAVLAAVGIGWLLLGTRRRSVRSTGYRDLGSDQGRPAVSSYGPDPSRRPLGAGGQTHGQGGSAAPGQSGGSVYGQGGDPSGGAAAYPSTTRLAGPAGQGGTGSGLGSGSTSGLGGTDVTPGGTGSTAGGLSGTGSAGGVSPESSNDGTDRPAVRGDGQGSTGGI